MMFNWFSQGYFGMNLEIRRAEDVEFKKLGQHFKILIKAMFGSELGLEIGQWLIRGGGVIRGVLLGVLGEGQCYAEGGPRGARGSIIG